MMMVEVMVHQMVVVERVIRMTWIVWWRHCCINIHRRGSCGAVTTMTAMTTMTTVTAMTTMTVTTVTPVSGHNA